MLLFFCLLAELIRFSCCFACFVGFYGERLLLREGFGFCFFGFCPLAGSFFGGLLCFGLGGFRLSSSSLSLDPCGICFRSRPCLGFCIFAGTGGSFFGCSLFCSGLSLGFFFGFLLYGHHA